MFGTDTQSSEPTRAGSPAPSFDPGETESDFAAARTVDPGWDAPAQEADGTFLSMHETADSLEYRAVDSTGEVLWTAQRPRACSAYLVTSTNDGPIAVLMDQGSSSGSSLTPTASGYDLTTGEKQWGPVETPGPLLGNGLVFAGAPKDFIGVGGPRTALDPTTGDVVAVEDESEGTDAAAAEGGREGEGGSTEVIAMFGEHLVRSQGSDIVGESPDGRRLWIRAAEDFGMSASELRETPWESIGTSHALLGDAGSHARTLIDLRSGATVDSEIAEAWFDSSSSTLVTVGSHLRGFDAAGTKRWSTPAPDNAEVAAVGGGLITFVSDGGTDSKSDDSDSESRSDSGSGAEPAEQPVTARSARDGDPVDGDTPLLATIQQLGAPHHISASGAALIGDPQTPLLITTQGRTSAAPNVGRPGAP